MRILIKVNDNASMHDVEHALRAKGLSVIAAMPLTRTIIGVCRDRAHERQIAAEKGVDTVEIAREVGA